MKGMPLGELLRYGLAGGNLLVLFYLRYRPELPAVDEIGTSAIVLGASLLLGAIVYSLHRALPYPFIMFPLALRIAGYRSSVKEFEKERDAALDTNARVQRHAPEWGAQVHFLYTLCWSTLLAPLLGSLAGLRVTANPGYWIYALAVAYLVAGVIHHVRLIRFIKSA
jgi:hypothetical protein